ncbi:MAG: hypothetical protein MJ231_00955 [bacterium]|nr:hypothetical protein [bacterium]
MGIFDKLSRYSDVIKLGLTQEQAQHIDELDGKKDNKYEGRSLFDVVSEHKKNYDNGGNKNFFGEKVNFYDYICSKLEGFGGILDLKGAHIIDRKEYSPNDIATELVDAIFKIGTGDLDNAIDKIGNNNIIDVLSLYQEKANKKNSILGVKYDKETLFEAILDENIPNNKKKEYLTKLMDCLLYSMPMENEKHNAFKQRFETAIDNALSKHWPNQSSSEIDSIVKEILGLRKSYSLDCVNEKKDEKTDNLNEEINTKDILGNGKLDNPAKQISINCRAHAMINGILATKKGEKYLNSLIHKDKSTGNITVYLPGAKEAGLPKPNGDGKYTYTENQILNNINKAGTGQRMGKGLGYYKSKATSIGDGDETALLMAMQDFLIESKGNDIDDSYPVLASFDDEDYTNALFGKEIKNYATSTFEYVREEGIIAPESDIAYLEKEIKDLKEQKQTDETKAKILEYTGMLITLSSDNKKKIEYLKDIFESGKFFIKLGVLGGTDLTNVEQIGTNGYLVDKHAYAIKSIGEDTITLVESNNPKSLITIGIEDFFNKFMIDIYEYPDDI